MKELFKHWYLLDATSWIVWGPFDFTTASIKAVENSNLKSEYTIASDEIGKARISTVFHGVDLNRFDDDVLPQQFETIVNGGELHGMKKQYSNYYEALEGHGDIREYITYDLMQQKIVI